MPLATFDTRGLFSSRPAVLAAENVPAAARGFGLWLGDRFVEIEQDMAKKKSGNGTSK